jgi:hypothetical protein
MKNSDPQQDDLRAKLWTVKPIVQSPPSIKQEVISGFELASGFLSSKNQSAFSMIARRLKSNQKEGHQIGLARQNPLQGQPHKTDQESREFIILE